MSTEITFTVDDELMSALRRVRRQKRSAAKRNTRVSELSEESDADVVAGLLRDAFGSQVQREKNRGGSTGVIGADRRSQPD